MVVFDSSILLFILDENTPSSVPEARERVSYLIETLSEAGEKIIIPTPVLSECLEGAGDAGPDYLSLIHGQSCFRVVPFDERAAVETAAQLRHAKQGGFPKGGNPDAKRPKIKFDRMIVAIAAVERATAIYSDDKDVCTYAREAGLEAYQLRELNLPPEDPQAPLPFETPRP